MKHVCGKGCGGRHISAVRITSITAYKNKTIFMITFIADARFSWFASLAFITDRPLVGHVECAHDPFVGYWIVVLIHNCIYESPGEAEADTVIIGVG